MWGWLGGAFAGDLAANESTLGAMRQVGIPISSNRDLDTKSSIQSRVNDYFAVRHDIAARDGLTDLPVTALRSSIPWTDGTYRHLQVCALSDREMINALTTLESLDTLREYNLTHPGE